MVEAKLFLELLMGLLTDPARLDGARELLDWRVVGQVGEIIFALASGAVFADQPDLLPGQVLGAHRPDALRRSIRHPDPDGGETGGEPSLGPAPPADLTPSCTFQHCLGGNGFAVGDVPLARPATASL